MFKITNISFALIFFILLTVFSATPVLALIQCKKIDISNTPLNNHSASSIFTIDVDGTNGYKSWGIKFPDCRDSELTAAATGDNIVAALSNTTPPGNFCPFFPGTHKLIAVGEKPDGSKIEVCEASYTIIDRDTLCKLEIDPKDGITPITDVRVSASDVNKGPLGNAGYAFFFDKNLLFLNINNNNMRDLQIPSDLLTSSTHTIDIRYASPGSVLLGITEKLKNITHPLTVWQSLKNITNISDGFSQPFCSISFTVGTINNPGGVTSTGSGPYVPQACIGKPDCATAAGSGLKGCTDDPTNPGISTAIGCIHTKPTVFIENLFKFLLGISGGIAFLMMIIGSFQMITSRGNPQSIQAGRERFTSALIGLLFVIFSVLLLQIIGTDILGIFPK